MARTSYGDWHLQRTHNGLHYPEVYSILDELTQEGFTPFQIAEILRLGRDRYLQNKRENENSILHRDGY